MYFKTIKKSRETLDSLSFTLIKTKQNNLIFLMYIIVYIKINALLVTHSHS